MDGRMLTRLAPLLGVGLVMLIGCSGPAPKSMKRKTVVPASAREVNVERKLAQRQIAFVEELLIGEPGVYVDGRTVRIRGSKRAPTWVIDGMYVSSPVGLNPRDVARMWVVPDGSGYGRRGAYGVIIIETRVDMN